MQEVTSLLRKTKPLEKCTIRVVTETETRASCSNERKTRNRKTAQNLEK